MGNRIFIVGESEAGVRLDQYLGLKFENVSRSQLQKKISDFVLLNNKKTKSAQKLRIGDVISIDEGFFSSPVFSKLGMGGVVESTSVAPSPTIEPGSQEVTASVTIRYEIK